MADIKGSITLNDIRLHEVTGDPTMSFTGNARSGDAAFLNDGANAGLYLFGSNLWTKMLMAGDITLGDGVSSYSEKIGIFSKTVNTDSSSKSTFNLTVDGTSNGAALFSTVLGYIAVPSYTGSSASGAHSAHFFSLSGDNKQIVFRCVKGDVIFSILITGAATLIFSGSGVPVTCLVVGVRP